MKWIQDLRKAISNITNKNDVKENVNLDVIIQEEQSSGLSKYTVYSNNEITYIKRKLKKLFQRARNVM